MKTSKNQRKAPKIEAPLVKKVPNFYGFNSCLWQQVEATDAADAERQIRADNGLTKNIPLTVKPL